jgi:hypothetical protein
MRLTLDELKVAAMATRNYDGLIAAWRLVSGRGCPATEIYDFRHGGKVNIRMYMDENRELRNIYSSMVSMVTFAGRLDMEPLAGGAIFDALLTSPSGRALLAGIFDSIIVCADPTWSSREGVEPAETQPKEREMAEAVGIFNEMPIFSHPTKVMAMKWMPNYMLNDEDLVW